MTARKISAPRRAGPEPVDLVDAPDLGYPREDSTGDIVDPATGLPRLLARKCRTCIYRPGNLMHLQPGRREQMETTALERGSWIVCHSTLPAAGQPDAGVCRGFYDVNHAEVPAFALARWLGEGMGVRWPEQVQMEPPTPNYLKDAETP